MLNIPMTFYLSKINVFAIILLGLVLPISTAATNGLIFLIFLIWLINGNLRLVILKQQPVALWSMSLFFLIMISFIYTSGSWEESADIFFKYKELFLLSLFIIAFSPLETKKYAWFALLVSIVITLIVSYFYYLGIPISGKASSNAPAFKNYITQSIIMVFAAYTLILFAFFNKKYRFPALFLAILALFDTLFLSFGRTGYILFFILMLLLLWQLFKIRGLISGIVLAVIVAIGLYHFSPTLQHRLIAGFNDIEKYEQGHPENTSLGMRLEYYKYSWELFKQSPLIGKGTGSFENEYAKISPRPTSNPHNEYLMIGTQWGLIGVILFVGILVSLWKMAKVLPLFEGYVVQGLALTMASICLVNSALLDFTEAHLFAWLVGLLCSQRSQ
jgi:O-antigen ligase